MSAAPTVLTPDPLALLPPVTGVVGAGGASGTSLPVTGVAGKIQPGFVVTGTGIPANTTIVKQLPPITTVGGAGTYQTSNPTTAAATASVTFTPATTLAFFPAFSIIVPPPPIGADKVLPNFPPPQTPPALGQVPVGDLVGPAIAPAPVPPSVAGYVQPRFGTGSGTTPAVGGYFPVFTTTFPSPTIVFTNTAMIGPLATMPYGSPPVPPSTASTQNILIGGWAPQRPPWLFSGVQHAMIAASRLARPEPPGEPVLHSSEEEEPPDEPRPHHRRRRK